MRRIEEGSLWECRPSAKPSIMHSETNEMLLCVNPLLYIELINVSTCCINGLSICISLWLCLGGH